MNVKRIVGLLVILLVVFFIWTRPDSAASSVETIWATLRSGAESVSTFFARLV